MHWSCLSRAYRCWYAFQKMNYLSLLATQRKFHNILWEISMTPCCFVLCCGWFHSRSCPWQHTMQDQADQCKCQRSWHQLDRISNSTDTRPPACSLEWAQQFDRNVRQCIYIFGTFALFWGRFQYVGQLCSLLQTSQAKWLTPCTYWSSVNKMLRHVLSNHNWKWLCVAYLRRSNQLDSRKVQLLKIPWYQQHALLSIGRNMLIKGFTCRYSCNQFQAWT